MYHTVAYATTSVNGTGVDIPAVADNWIPIQNTHYLPSVDLMLFGGYFYGAALTKVTLNTPRSRMIVPPVLYPVVGALLPPTRIQIFDRRFNPFRLNSVEEVQMLVDDSGSEDVALIMHWGDRLDPIPQGDIYSLHGTSSDTTVAQAWSPIAITWDQNLPAGRYAVIGTQHVSTNAQAHRLNFPGQIMRPGFSSLASVADISEPSYYYGGWGKLGEFVTYAFPLWEAFTDGADSSHDVVMNLIKVG